MFKLEKSTEFCHIRGHQFSDTTKQASRYASYSSIGVEFSGRKLRSWWNKVSSIKLFYMNLRKLAVHWKKKIGFILGVLLIPMQLTRTQRKNSGFSSLLK